MDDSEIKRSETKRFRNMSKILYIEVLSNRVSIRLDDDIVHYLHLNQGDILELTLGTGTSVLHIRNGEITDISYISHRSSFLDIVSFILDWDKTCSTRTSLNFLLERGEVLDITRDRRINKILGE